MQTVNLPRVAIVCDMLEENWPSMELVADMLLSSLQKKHSGLVAAVRIQPAMRRRFTKLRLTVSNGNSANGNFAKGNSHASGTRFNADRLLNRFWDYPRYLESKKTEFDLFHIIDHSYAQVVHALPPERTIVTCHDLDTFQCLLNPILEPRSTAFRRMANRTLSGLRRAARVTCDSYATRDELLRYGLVKCDRAVVIPNGVHETCSPNPDPTADAEADRLLGSSDSIDIMHVGSTIPRKRIDVLLHVFARLRRQFRNARLLRVGGKFTGEQAKLAQHLGITDAVMHLPHLDRRTLAAMYRRATVVLLPSEREGFGLPVVEAMACGTPVVATDLSVLREVGGTAAEFCEVGNVEAWTTMVASLLDERLKRPQLWQKRRDAGLAQASKFTWTEYARQMVDVYESVLRSVHEKAISAK